MHQPRLIDEYELCVLSSEDPDHRQSSGLGLGAGYGEFPTHQSIQQGRLAYVGLAHNRHGCRSLLWHEDIVCGWRDAGKGEAAPQDSGLQLRSLNRNMGTQASCEPHY